MGWFFPIRVKISRICVGIWSFQYVFLREPNVACHWLTRLCNIFVLNLGFTWIWMFECFILFLNVGFILIWFGLFFGRDMWIQKKSCSFPVPPFPFRVSTQIERKEEHTKQRWNESFLPETNKPPLKFNGWLASGFKFVLCSPLFGEDS